MKNHPKKILTFQKKHPPVSFWEGWVGSVRFSFVRIVPFLPNCIDSVVPFVPIWVDLVVSFIKFDNILAKFVKICQKSL